MLECIRYVILEHDVFICLLPESLDVIVYEMLQDCHTPAPGSSFLRSYLYGNIPSYGGQMPPSTLCRTIVTHIPCRPGSDQLEVVSKCPYEWFVGPLPFSKMSQSQDKGIVMEMTGRFVSNAKQSRRTRRSSSC